MSSSDRRSVLTLLAALPLAACGFSPAYAPGGAAGRLHGRVAVAAPTDRNGFELVRQLETRLGQPVAPLFDLTTSLSLRRVSGGITPDNQITRYQLQGTAVWSLSQIEGERVAGGTARSFTSWSATGSTIAGLAAEEDAARRLMVILADQIVTQIIAKAPDIAP